MGCAQMIQAEGASLASFEPPPVPVLPLLLLDVSNLRIEPWRLGLEEGGNSKMVALPSVELETPLLRREDDSKAARETRGAEEEEAPKSPGTKEGMGMKEGGPALSAGAAGKESAVAVCVAVVWDGEAEGAFLAEEGEGLRAGGGRGFLAFGGEGEPFESEEAEDAFGTVDDGS